MNTAIVTVLLGSLTLPALASEPAGGLVTRIQGRISISSSGQPTQPLPPFYRVKTGDRIDLASGATLQLVLLQNGRQEIWRGPVKLAIDNENSRCEPDPCQAEVKQLPTAVLATLSRSPTVISDIRNRSGMVMVRAAGANQPLEEANGNYRTMREQADEADITPELYLLTRLYQLRQYREIPRVLDDMQKRQPGNPEVIAARKQFTAQWQEMERRRKARAEGQ